MPHLFPMTLPHVKQRTGINMVSKPACDACSDHRSNAVHAQETYVRLMTGEVRHARFFACEFVEHNNMSLYRRRRAWWWAVARNDSSFA